MKKIIIFFLALIHFLCISVFAKDDINWQPYMQKLQQDIKYNWHPPKSSRSNKISTKFNIKKTGEITDIKIIASSNDKKIDEAAIKAIKNISWQHPLPKEFDKNEVSIEFTFDYNIENTINHTSSKFVDISNYQNYKDIKKN